MTPEEKAVYNQRAKKTEPGVKHEKCDTRGVPISFREREEQDKQQVKMKALQEVEQMVSNLSALGSNTTQNSNIEIFNIFKIVISHNRRSISLGSL